MQDNSSRLSNPLSIIGGKLTPLDFALRQAQSFGVRLAQQLRTLAAWEKEVTDVWEFLAQMAEADGQTVTGLPWAN